MGNRRGQASLALLLCCAVPAAAKRSLAFALPACERPRPDEFVFGLSGPAGDSTDEFGRENLRALAQGVSPERLALFAPGRASSVFGDPLAAPQALRGLAARPERSIRVILTGHGEPDGVWLGKTSSGEDAFLEPSEFEADVAPARRSGKTVRGLFLSCYSGHFAAALMPQDGLAPACGAFSTLPEKKSEGCYENPAQADRQDYLAAAARLDDCRPGREWQAVHARVVERLEGYDIPMLTSDYFLLYGPAARWLGRASRAPYPAGGLVRKKLGGGLVVYADLVNDRVVKSLRGGRVLPAPQESVVGCLHGLEGADKSLDDVHSSAFFLHDETDPADDCVPAVSLAWHEGGAVSSAAVQMAAVGDDEVFDPAGSGVAAADFRAALSEEELQVPIEGLKPPARMLFSRVLPLFSDGQKGTALAGRLKEIAGWAQSQDPARARLMRDLIQNLEGRDRDGRGTDQGTLFWGSWMRDYLVELANENDTDPETLDYSRLALYVAVTAAERDLREEAQGEPAARRLVSDLEALRACERGLP